MSGDVTSMTGLVLDGRYQVGNLLGAGGMGAVYRGVQRSVGRNVAIKVLRVGVFTTEESKVRFEREAQVMAGLEHPNIVRLYDFGSHEKGVFMVLELVEGKSLHDVLQGRSLAPDLAMEIVRQIATGMAEAHARGIVHRDLKPANIMITSDSSGAMRVVILDFGLARPSRQDVRLTTNGLVYGTPEYIAPEYARGNEFDETAEIYALGVVLYEMLTGKPPFTGDPLQVLFQQVSEPTPGLDEAVASGQISEACANLTMSMLEKSPENRQPKSMLGLVQRLEMMGIGKRRFVRELDEGLRAPVSVSRQRPKLEPNKVRAGSTPFLEADDAVKGAWQDYVRKTGAIKLDEPLGQGTVIDPNIDGSLEFGTDPESLIKTIPREGAPPITEQMQDPRGELPTMLSVPGVDQSSEMSRFTTERMNSVFGSREGMGTIPATDVKIQAAPAAPPPEPSPKRAQPQSPELAFDPRERFSQERQRPEEPPKPKAAIPARLILVVAIIVLVLLVAIVLQLRNFAPEADTLSKEELLKLYEEEADEAEKAEKAEQSTGERPQESGAKKAAPKKGEVIDLFEGEAGQDEPPSNIKIERGQ